MRFYMFAASAAVLAVVCCGCHSSTSSASLAPEQFLKWSMDRYAMMNAYSADCQWNALYRNHLLPDKPLKEVRTVAYMSPNLFKVTSESHGVTVETLCDGNRLVDASLEKDTHPEAFPAPPAVDAAKSEFIQNPLLCGSLLYTFFGGSPHYGDLVDSTKGTPTFGPDEQHNAETCRDVRFFAAGPNYGHAEILIGERTGLVYRIAYDSASSLPRMAARTAAKYRKYAPESGSSVENYSDIKIEPKINSSLFVYSPPKGVTVVDLTKSGAPTSPIPLGSSAPSAELPSLDGSSTVRLSSLKGKVVLIDFWATWCGPCRQTLPHTEDLFKKYGGRGLDVLTVSDETEPKIAAFLKSNHYDFPTYRDPSHATQSAFRVQFLPTVVILDKKGNIADYLVGARPEADLLSALKKAGLS